MIKTLKSVLTAVIFAAATFVVATHTFGRALAHTPVCAASGCTDAAR